MRDTRAPVCVTCGRPATREARTSRGISVHLCGRRQCADEAGVPRTLYFHLPYGAGPETEPLVRTMEAL
jgi:hypothetical protein